MQKDFITATPDSGGSGSTTVTAAASANQTESARSVNLSVAGGGMTRTVAASQAAEVVTWNYYFSVTPTSLSFVAGGESKTVTVTSYRKKVINGVETSTQENVAWTATISGTGFSKNTDGTTITAGPSISSSIRTGEASYTQATSGKTGKVSLTQAAYVQPNNVLTITGMTEMNTYFLFKGTSNPVATGTSYFGINGIVGETEEQWSPTNPLRVNDPTKTGGMTITATTGDTVTIKIRNGSSWTQVGSITLQNKDQTVRVSQ